MSTEMDPKHLSAETPIDAQTLSRFAELENARGRLGVQLIDIEAEKVKIMVAARRIAEERLRLFEKVLTDRGLTPDTPVQIDAETGQIKLLVQPKTANEPSAG